MTTVTSSSCRRSIPGRRSTRVRNQIQNKSLSKPRGKLTEPTDIATEHTQINGSSISDAAIPTKTAYQHTALDKTRLPLPDELLIPENDLDAAKDELLFLRMSSPAEDNQQQTNFELEAENVVLKSRLTNEMFKNANLSHNLKVCQQLARNALGDDPEAAQDSVNTLVSCLVNWRSGEIRHREEKQQRQDLDPEEHERLYVRQARGIRQEKRKIARRRARSCSEYREGVSP